MNKKFDTPDKKLAFIAPGNIITFKKQVQGSRQLGLSKVTKLDAGTIFLKGVFNTVIKFSSEKELLDAIDWDWMEENLTFKDYSNL